MTDQLPRQPELLDIAATSLRELPIAAGPSPTLVARTLEALCSPSPQLDEFRRHARRTRMFHIARYSGLTAAMAAAAIILGWTIFHANTGSVAFGDVIQEVQDAESVQVTIKHTLADDQEYLAKWWLTPDHFRMEYPGLAVYIIDRTLGQSLQLDLSQKTALRSTLSVEESEQASDNFLRQLNRLDPANARRLGDELLHGRTTLVYQFDTLDNVQFLGLESAEARMKLWINPETRLPVRIIVEVVSSGENINDDDPFDTVLTFEEFIWNDSLAASLFSLDVPEGFTFQDPPADADLTPDP